MTSCGFGPCDNSREMGGAGCDLCDRVAHLPQPEQAQLFDDGRKPRGRPRTRYRITIPPVEYAEVKAFAILMHKMNPKKLYGQWDKTEEQKIEDSITGHVLEFGMRDICLMPKKIYRWSERFDGDVGHNVECRGTTYFTGELLLHLDDPKKYPGRLWVLGYVNGPEVEPLRWLEMDECVKVWHLFTKGKYPCQGVFQKNMHEIETLVVRMNGKSYRPHSAKERLALPEPSTPPQLQIF